MYRGDSIRIGYHRFLAYVVGDLLKMAICDIPKNLEQIWIKELFRFTRPPVFESFFPIIVYQYGNLFPSAIKGGDKIKIRKPPRIKAK